MSVPFENELHVRWSRFFDLAGWRWAYKPIWMNPPRPTFWVRFDCGHSECHGYHELFVDVRPFQSLDQFGNRQLYRQFNSGTLTDGRAAFGSSPAITEWYMEHGSGSGIESIGFWVENASELWELATGKPGKPRPIVMDIADVQPNYRSPYNGTTPIEQEVLMWDGKTLVPLARAIEIINSFGGNVGSIYQRFGDWCVTTGGVDCLSHPYWVEIDRLHEEDWVRHMAEKDWVNIADFSMALESARKRFLAEQEKSPRRKPPGYRLSTKDKEAIDKSRKKEQLKRAKKLLEVRKKVNDLSNRLEGPRDE